jgi:hypothetical protein
MVCTAVASGAFTLATYAWRSIQADDRATREAAIDALEQRLRGSREKLARLPRLREASRGQPAQQRAALRSRGGDWRAVADLASRAGVTLRSLTPVSSSHAQVQAQAAQARAGNSAGRAMRLEGRADFAGLYAFFNGLSSLPILVVPEALDIKKDKGSLAFGATLNAFDMPPPRAETATHARTAAPTGARSGAGRPIADPFGEGQVAARPSASVGRLLGIVHDGRRALALFEAASGPQVLAAVPGQTLGADRLIGIDARGVTLAGRTGTRRISLSSEGG